MLAENHTPECQAAWDKWTKAAREKTYPDDVLALAVQFETAAKDSGCSCWGAA